MYTLGLLGGAINFLYPASYVSYYSCLSLAGLRTVLYHGAMVFTGITLLLSGDHRLDRAAKPADLLLPAVPALLMLPAAAAANAALPGADYMFLRMESFFFAPIGRATPDWLSAILATALLLAVHALPYLPAYLKNRKAP